MPSPGNRCTLADLDTIGTNDCVAQAVSTSNSNKIKCFGSKLDIPHLVNKFSSQGKSPRADTVALCHRILVAIAEAEKNLRIAGLQTVTE